MRESNNAHLKRFTTSSKGTPGVLTFEHSDLILYTLELPDRKNKRCVSSIPNDDYELRYLKSSYSGKYKNIYHVVDVPGRTGILIHNGNYLRHIKGCILVGMSTGIYQGQYCVWNSRRAMELLNSSDGLNQENGVLTITNIWE